MPVRKITEQQFRTRRKDRKMVWVDAFAFLVGLLVLAASVGGIIVLQEPEEPFDWDYSFFEGVVSYKACVGTIGAQVGCTPVMWDAQPEGDTKEGNFDPVEQPNVTRVTFTLTWLDNRAPNEENTRVYPYTNNSTDILRLEVETPWGERVAMDGENLAEPPYTGSVKLDFNISSPPEPGKFAAFTYEEADQGVLDLGQTLAEHQGLGKWRAWVTVLRAGHQNGTLPTQSPCPEDVEIPRNPSNMDCNMYTNQQYLERGGVGNIATAGGYESSWEDKGQDWVLDMAIRTYRHVLSF